MKASCNLSTPYTLQPSYAPSVSSAPPSRPGSAPVPAGRRVAAGCAGTSATVPRSPRPAPRRGPAGWLGMPTALAKQTCAPHRASLALESTADAWSELLTTWHCSSLPSPTLVLHRQHRRNGQRWRVDSPAYFFIFSSFCSFASLSLPGAGPPPEPVKGLARGYAVFSPAQAGSELGKCKPDDAERTRDRQRKRGVPTAAPALSLPPARR